MFDNFFLDKGLSTSSLQNGSKRGIAENTLEAFKTVYYANVVTD